jgi:hypothetical protein
LGLPPPLTLPSRGRELYNLVLKSIATNFEERPDVELHISLPLEGRVRGGGKPQAQFFS